MDLHQENAASYEFDAPSHVVDFASLDVEDNADRWFDRMSDPAACQLITPLKTDKPWSSPANTDIPRAVVSPRPRADNATKVSDEDNPNSAVPSNVVTSWGNGHPSTSLQAQRKAPSRQPRRVSKRKEAVRQEENKRVVDTPPPQKKPRRSSVSRPLRRSVSASGSQRGVRNAAPAARSAVATTAVKRSASLKQKSSEQLEIEHMQALQKEVAEQRKKNEASFKAAVAGSQPVRKPALSTTVPVEFRFRTDARLKAQTEAPADGAYKEVDFTTQLRKHPSSPAKALRGTTVPKPFNLSGGTKRKHEETEAYVPMAQAIESFQRRTPARYHLRSRQREERGPSPMKMDKLKITHPQTPQLMTRQRSRPMTAKSSAEIEAEEVEKLRQFKFKALELNRKILEEALVPKKPTPKEVTQPEGFHLEVERRVQERKASKKPEEPEDHTFHSRPVPVRILEDVVGVPEKKVQNPTVPESPAFALKNRVRVERKVEETKPSAPVKVIPMPHFGLPFQPKLPEKTQVEVCPFSFEAREREKQALKEKRLEHMRHEEVPKFKAQPLPDFSEVHLPAKKVAEPTKVEPFKLIIDERGTTKSERWEQMMKEELKQQAEAASFKARPNTITHKEPFIPKKENRSVLVADGFQLSTERRAKERLEFDRAVCEKEALRARMEEEERRQQEEQEKEEIARLRQEQVHKAQPIRRYKAVELKRSEVPLTIPQSPNFSDRFRL
ncbi:targeting protein for Xklp2 [Megalops cyprinoides]|uniref:targeting protein for Xklp2 n=1 Tax=Megalops cyprinoides TaxID=118141 RepID=UPI001863BA97|nr:targeting protein for Xklp2 [Megalops cyprinoides]